MPGTWTERLLTSFLLLALFSMFSTAPAQEGGPPEREGPPADVTSMGLLGLAADPQAIILGFDRPHEELAFSSSHVPAKSGDDRSIRHPLGTRDFGRGEETVLAEVEGPGVITTIWLQRDMGQLRVRLDDEPEAVLDVESEALIKGIVQLFRPPLLARMGGGARLLRPIPFARKVVVTCARPDGAYLIEARRYRPETTVDAFHTSSAIGESFPLAAVLNQVEADAGALEALESSLNSALVIPEADAAVKVAAGAEQLVLEREVEEASCLDWIELEELAPFAKKGLSPDLLIKVEVDGEETLNVPLVQLFGGPDFFEAHSRHLKLGEVLKNRLRRRRFLLPQPFSRSLRISVRNEAEEGSAKLRFRLQISDADPRVSGRVLRALVLGKDQRSARWPAAGVLVAGSLVTTLDAEALQRLRLKAPVDCSVAGWFGPARGQSWSSTFALGRSTGRGTQAFRSRLFDRCLIESGSTFELEEGAREVSLVFFAYTDATSKRDQKDD